MYFLRLLFSHNGRINRKEWWLGQVIGVLITVCLSLAFHLSIPHTLSIAKIFSIHNLSIGMVLGVLLFYIHLQLNIKRWHDIGKHGVWAAVCYIPVFGILISLIALGIIKGTDGDNDWGEYH